MKNRREFLAITTVAVTAMAITDSLLASSSVFATRPRAKMHAALVDTGIRGTTMWGRSVAEQYADMLFFAGFST